MKPPVLKTGAHTVGRGFESRPLRHLFTSKTDGIGALESGYLEPFPREYLASQEIAFGGAIKPRCFVKLSISRGAKLANWRHIVAPQFEPCPSAFQASKECAYLGALLHACGSMVARFAHLMRANSFKDMVLQGMARRLHRDFFGDRHRCAVSPKSFPRTPTREKCCVGWGPQKSTADNPDRSRAIVRDQCFRRDRRDRLEWKVEMAEYLQKISLA